jgi:hypothetical protein
VIKKTVVSKNDVIGGKLGYYMTRNFICFTGNLLPLDQRIQGHVPPRHRVFVLQFSVR